jgi:hypothetical protein
VRDVSREFFTLDYRLAYSSSSSKSWLVLSTNATVDLQQTWNLVDRSSQAADDWPYYVSEPIYASSKLGDCDGVNLPWFRQADSALLFWEIHHDTVNLPLRLRVAGRAIEVWPDSESWNDNDTPWMRTNEPLIMLFNDNGFNGTPISTRLPSQQTAEHHSPSRTFALRRAIQSILVPTGLFVYNHTGFVALGFVAILEVVNISFKLIAVYSLVVFICWVANGKPRFGSWVRSYWMTRHLIARLPGLNQDTSAWSTHYADDEDNTNSKRRPQSLRGPGDFFRSTSPLDDLFVTFEFTKSMIKPLTFRGKLVDTEDSAEVTGVPNDFKFNVSRRSTNQGQSTHGAAKHDLEKGSPAEG